MATFFPIFNKLWRLFKPVPLIDQPATTDEIATAPIEAVSFGQHVGPLFRTPSKFPPHM